jgi:Domain of unknown function (DUF4405)
MRRVQVNAIIDAIALVVFMALASTGLVLRWQLPPGSGEAFGRGMGRRAGERSVDLLWGLTRHEWGDYHYWIAVGLLAVLSVHLFLHWNWIVCVVRGKQTDASGWRLAIGLFSFAAITAVTALPLLTGTNTMTRNELQRQRSEPAAVAPTQEQARPLNPRDDRK